MTSDLHRCAEMIGVIMCEEMSLPCANNKKVQIRLGEDQTAHLLSLINIFALKLKGIII